MTKYRKNLVEVEAIKFTRQSYEKIKDLNYLKIGSLAIPRCIDGKATFRIDTLKGSIVAHEGDYIIKDEKGEIYTCNPDIFEQTYEAVKK